ncbi:hypothetical protein GALMADRAFT_148541 [Galerina marginata CBS 339.88]|uniref:MYND-type domain-containing protein n=1 Tax=Galerina marginata (strain CBS 339.88) TaxID=685588 RepID=A0A067SD09_GALM3|nr:hypothetical protein GALMADRAFT_148541 [Galerina marginata CBS 339.88]
MTFATPSSGQISASMSHILVPHSIVTEIKTNPALSTELAFSPYALKVRSILCDPRVGEKGLTKVLLANFLLPEMAFERHSILHAAAIKADILLVHEYLYAGYSPNLQGENGKTPIGMALGEAASLRKKNPSDDTTKKLARLERLIPLLIEQHADVNATHNGSSLLQLACQAESWNTVSLLLEHRAKPTLSHQKHFTKPEDWNRYSQLVATKSLPPGQPRPPRVCPCWSGKILAECHAAPGARIQYPSSYMCICGSKKSYKKCCVLKSPIFEVWDVKTGRILAYTDTASEELGAFRKMVRKMQALDFEEFRIGPGGNVRDLSDSPNIPFGGLDQGTLDLFRLEMVRRQKVDPAFAYAMKKYRFPLHVFFSSILSAPRMLRGAYQMNWNKAVDQYIDLGVDPRSKFDIEMEAKIGQWGGPLKRLCGHLSCGKVEDRDVKKMSQCAKCQITVYCSAECQRAAWPAHKADCGSPAQAPRPLWSQQNILDFMLEKVRSEEPDFDEMVANSKMLKKRGGS